MVANLEFKRALNFMGFVATICIAVALIISLIASAISGDGGSIPNFQISDLATAFAFIANILAYFITIVSGFYYAKSKRNAWFMVIQIIGTLVIIAAVIVGAIL